ncbi:Uu.00g024830.m01.CDS01 [Anthostomella pinea]|uniref:Protoheme IX farnesyltransferase, mitochondrial n=1 Tax=Anthostomella pinea TaxID=933095 RepID=A0AAI8V883_9PEZI|nr:Uu.00g024830.m01.CDS01 [Anthostomella pinea]
MSLRSPANVFRFYARDSLCRRCSYLKTASFSHTTSSRTALASSSPRLKADYFVSNAFAPRLHDDRNSRSRSSTAPNHRNDRNDENRDLPHRRRQAAKRIASSRGTVLNGTTAEAPLPPDASSLLTTASTRHPANCLRRQLSLLLSLSKPRLTVLVVLTAMAPYALYPVPAFLSPSIGLDTPSLSPLTLVFLSTGTLLCSASANALNMLYEPAWDAMMTRTRNRPLARGLLSQRKAIAFAALAALTGVGSLYFGVNPTVAFLGAVNIALYAGVYTPLKRVSWLNTWVGAIVGGIPPLMGWAAAAGESATGNGSFSELLLTSDAVGGWLLAALLFAWQFPHFMALSWPIRDEYKAAGHQMLAWVNSARNGRVALRYSLVFIPLCVALCTAGVTEWSFAVTSLPVNLWLAREAVLFWRHGGFKGSARGLFWASVWHLPAVMVLALVQKRGMWGRVWRSVVGEPELDDEDYDDWIDEAVAGAGPAVGQARVGAGAGVPPIASR